jgi:hypothetical protein
MVNTRLRSQTQFKWQGFYGAFTVSRWDVDQIVEYVKRQKEHHSAGSVRDEWEAAFEEIETG